MAFRCPMEYAPGEGGRRPSPPVAPVAYRCALPHLVGRSYLHLFPLPVMIICSSWQHTDAVRRRPVRPKGRRGAHSAWAHIAQHLLTRQIHYPMVKFRPRRWPVFGHKDGHQHKLPCCLTLHPPPGPVLRVPGRGEIYPFTSLLQGHKP